MTERCNYEGGHTWRWIHDEIAGGFWECRTCRAREAGTPAKRPANLEEVVGLAELARRTGLRHDQLRRAAREGRLLAARKAGGVWLSSEAHVGASLECGVLQRRRGRPSHNS
jgi:hypothetical protein